MSRRTSCWPLIRSSMPIRRCTASWCSCRCRKGLDSTRGDRRDRPGQGCRRLSIRSTPGGWHPALFALTPCTPLGCIMLVQARCTNSLEGMHAVDDRPLEHGRQAAGAAAAQRELPR
ncbi:MAG: hypothetical protein MZV49_23005 [Rhodopseudomonas palustris]|nr:hypothetical protein [Rhodopseudomonas palustris]